MRQDEVYPPEHGFRGRRPTLSNRRDYGGSRSKPLIEVLQKGRRLTNTSTHCKRTPQSFEDEKDVS